MSSEDDMYSSEESYEFEFEDEDDVAQDDPVASGSDIEPDDGSVENDYYTAKALKDEDDTLAVKKFEKIIQLEPTDANVEFLFKATKQTAKVLFAKRELAQCLDHLKTLKTFIPSIANKKYVEDSINKMVTHYSNIHDNAFVADVYEVLLDILAQMEVSVGTDRVWIKINLNKFNLTLAARNLDQAEALIAAINQKLDSVDTNLKYSFQLEAIACEIELLSLASNLNLKRMNHLYKMSLDVTSPVTHPRIMGVIKGGGGKIEFYRRNFEKARFNFYESFKFFDESGSSNKKHSLKYLILCSIITSNEFNPFESQETQHYAHLQEFEHLILIIEYCNELDLEGYRSVVNKIKNDENKDAFFKEELFSLAAVEIEQIIMVKILLNLFKSYSVVNFRYMETVLGLSKPQLVEMLVRLGNTGRLGDTRINFVDENVTVDKQVSEPVNLPVTLDANAIFTNLQCMDASNVFGSSTSNIEDETPVYDDAIKENRAKKNWSRRSRLPKIASELILVPKTPIKKIQLLESIDMWLTMMKSSFPELVTDKVSTKDQIFNEQKAEKSGNLEVPTQIDVDEVEELQIDLLDNQEKVRVMQVWVKKLSAELNS